MKININKTRIEMTVKFTIYITALFMFCSALAHKSNGQELSNTIVTLSINNASLHDIFNEIEKQTPYRFVYDSKTKVSKEFSYKFDKTSLKKILHTLSEDTGTEFNVVNRSITVIKPIRELNNSMLITPIEGKVLDENGNPLPGATVLVKGTTIGTTTDFDGVFSIDLNPGDILEVSYVGYRTVEITYSNQANFEISLEPAATMLDDIVLIGYGSVSKKELTGSAANAENIENRAVTKVEEALQGNVAGVTVVSNGGDPTSTPVIKIRGVGTTSPEGPLWVVDGVPYYGGPLNPFDIESITVLKDAASASIYGVRAAGGVILVQTKQGKAGKITVDFGVFTGAQSVYNKPTALNAQQYTDAYNLAYDNSGTPRPDYFDAAKNPGRLENKTNWVDEIFRTGLIQNYDIGLRGGSENFKFSSSVGYNTKDGILLNTYANRLSFRFNSTTKINDKIKVGQNFSFTKTNGQSVFTGTQGENGETNYNGIIAAAIKAPPFMSIYNADGTYTDVSDGQNGDVLHPVGTLNRIDVDNPSKSYFGNLFLEYKPLQNIKFKSSFGMNYTDTNYEEFQPRVAEQSKVQTTVNRLITEDSEGTNWSWENTLDYTPNIGDDSNFQILAGYALQQEEFEANYLRARGFENEQRSLISIPRAESIEETKYAYKVQTLVSYFSRALYDYKKKYFISASIRRDGSSKLLTPGTDKHWQNFPSVAAGWSISEEEFFDSEFISNLKLRASWGRVGNIESLGSFPTNLPLSIGNVILGGNGYKRSIALDGKSNPNIRWETSETTNFGLDFSSINNKYSLTADYFIRDTKDLLLRLPVSPLEGILAENAPYQNAGEVRNSGLELALGVNKYEGDFTYNLSGNISFIKNELTKLSGGFSSLDEGQTQVATHYPLVYAVNQPLGSFYLIETDGLLRTAAQVTEARANGQPNAQLGDIKFIDQNNDQKIDSKDRVHKGSAFPKTTFGFNGNFNYKNFDLSIFIQGASGAYAYNGYSFTTAYPAHTSVTGANLSSIALDTWSAQNPNAAYPRLSIDDPNQNIRMSDFWLESTDYVRVKNLSVGYSLKGNDIFDALRIYATAQNLITWTNYSGLDPEVGNNGIDGGQYPVSRVFTLGFNVTLK